MKLLPTISIIIYMFTHTCPVVAGQDELAAEYQAAVQYITSATKEEIVIIQHIASRCHEAAKELTQQSILSCTIFIDRGKDLLHDHPSSPLIRGAYLEIEEKLRLISSSLSGNKSTATAGVPADGRHWKTEYYAPLITSVADQLTLWLIAADRDR